MTEPKLKKTSFFGIEVDLPEEVADKVIAERDKRITEYNQLKSALDSISKEKTEMAAKVASEEKSKKELELAKKGELDALRESVTKEYKEKISSLETTLVRQKIRDAVLTIDNVNKKALDDISTLIEKQNPKLEGDKVLIGEKQLVDVAKELVSSRDYFQVVNSPVGTGAATATAPKKVVSSVDTVNVLVDGMKERQGQAR